MSETKTESGIILPPGVSVTMPRPRTDGSCPGCGADKEKFLPVFGDMEVCNQCGLDRKQERNG